TLGIMTFFQVPFTVFTQVLPSFLLAVGVGDSVHLLSIFYRRYSETEDKLNSLRFAINHTGLAMFMTSITTAAGLLSFAVSEIAAVGNLGIFGALGVMLAFVYSILLLPTLIVLLPLRSEASHKGGTHRIIEDSISRISVFATRHSGKVILASAVLAIIATIGVSKLRIHYDAISWLPKGNPVRVASEVLDREMHGAMFVEIVLDTGVAGGVKQPEFLNQLEALQHKISNMTGEEDMYVGKTIAITDILKLIHQALNENNPAFHQIPQNPDLIAQELLLFENSGSDDLRAVVDSQYQETRLTVKLPWTSAGAYALFLADMRSVIESHFSSKPSFTITGMITLLTETTTHAIKSMIQSYSIAAVTIGIMMILLLQSVRVGLIAMIPNLFPILIALGFMGLLGFPLDLASILVGSIAIGLSVDDTIHFMHHFKRYFTESGDVVKAVDNTLHTSGRAMLVTTIVLSIGFFIFALSDMKNLISFGLITGIATIMALLADIILAPALMAFAVKNRSVCRCLER
ncbi:MAG: MMPL family transporter, partial [Gammaproteobacteria bacterium]|nr:MMPL family transporter [Gammaproteobacteria bacterium]